MRSYWLVDVAIAFLVLLVIMAIYGTMPTAVVWSLPLFLGLAVVAALGVGLWLSALNVQYRDIRYVVPFLPQFWMYATPIAYSSELIPKNWLWLYSLNPMTGVVGGFRWALLGKSTLNLSFLLIWAVVVWVMFIRGKGVRIIYEDRPQGKGQAVRSGFKQVTGDIIPMQDADLKYNEPLKIAIDYNSRSFLAGKKIRFSGDALAWLRASIKYRFTRLE